MIAQAGKEPTYEDLFLQNVQLKQELDQLKRLIFGSKHERFIPTPSAGQLALDIVIPSVVPPVAAMESIQYERKKAGSKPESEKAHTGRMPLPASLPCEQIIIEPTSLV